MKKDFNQLIKELRPAAVMLLCTCLAFSVTVSCAPTPQKTAVSETDVQTEAAPAEEETSASEETGAAPEEEETKAVRDLTAPAPYRLNFAFMYDEGSDESYAGILMKELIQKDSQWYAGIYDMANMAPAKLASRLGHSQAQVLGKYNPASKTQSASNPTTWAVEHFKNVRVSFYDGDGNITSAVSNAQQILSMASVYCYYNGIEDLASIRSYANKLWAASHSYGASMGEVYYCSGCVDPEKLPGEEQEDSELEGEDYFNGVSSIDTEITVRESGEVTEGTNASEEDTPVSDGETAKDNTSGADSQTVPVTQTEKTTPALSGTTMAAETTMSPIASLAETAESIYIEETKPKVTIVRPGDSTTAAKESQARVTGTGPASDEPETVPESSGSSEEGTEKTPEAETEEETTEAEESGSRKATIVRGEDVASLENVSSEGFGIEYKVQNAAVSSDSGSSEVSSALICPGHIDLKITAKIYSLDEKKNLFDIDQTGNTVEEGSEWSGWNERARAFVSHIERQDWTDAYGISVTMKGSKAPLSNAEIESYMKLLPAGTSQERQDIIRFALQSVGKVPYYWGGKASARGYSGNNFGSVTIPDYKGRILRGLDCSGWVNWVYWSVTGNHLAYEGTEGLKSLGRQVARQDLKPGDIIVITGNTPHVVMFLSWAENGQLLCIHETGSVSNVTVSVMNANWPYYRNLLD